MGLLRICAWEKLTNERIEEEVRCRGSLRNLLDQAAVQELSTSLGQKSVGRYGRRALACNYANHRKVVAQRGKGHLPCMYKIIIYLGTYHLHKPTADTHTREHLGTVIYIIINVTLHRKLLLAQANS